MGRPASVAQGVDAEDSSGKAAVDLRRICKTHFVNLTSCAACNLARESHAAGIQGSRVRMGRWLSETLGARCNNESAHGSAGFFYVWTSLETNDNNAAGITGCNAPHNRLKLRDRRLVLKRHAVGFLLRRSSP